MVDPFDSLEIAGYSLKIVDFVAAVRLAGHLLADLREERKLHPVQSVQNTDSSFNHLNFIFPSRY